MDQIRFKTGQIMSKRSKSGKMWAKLGLKWATFGLKCARLGLKWARLGLDWLIMNLFKAINKETGHSFFKYLECESL